MLFFGSKVHIQWNAQALSMPSMGPNKHSHPEPKTPVMIGNITISPQNPSWLIPANSRPAPKMQPPFFSCNLAPIYNWPKRTQNLCHMTRALASSRLSQLTSSPNPRAMHSSLLLASWFLRRAAAMRWQAHARVHPKPLSRGWVSHSPEKHLHRP